MKFRPVVFTLAPLLGFAMTSTYTLSHKGEGTSFAPSVRKSALPRGARELVSLVPLRGLLFTDVKIRCC